MFILHIYNADNLLTFRFEDLTHVKAFVGCFQRHFLLKDDLVYECNEIDSNNKVVESWYL